MHELTEQQINFLNSSGKVILCACPGSGKTHIVVRKVEKYLSVWEQSHQGVAVLSFTNVASDEIKNQLNTNEVVEGATSYPHFIGTVDSFINTFIVLQYGYLYNPDKLRPQIAFQNKWNYNFEFWRGECRRKGCVDKIEKFHYGIDGKFYYGKSEVLCKPNKYKTIPPCAEFKGMFERKGIVFQREVPSFALKILKENPEIAKAIAKRFPVILIDEAQDTSEEQMAIFDILIEAGVKESYLVGDPDQAIYEWRDATPKCFLDKLENNNWEQQLLTNNFRSSQHICNAVQLFSKTLEGKVPNTSMGHSAACDQKPILLLFSAGVEEAEIYDYFQNKCLEMGIHYSPESTAIITRGRIHSDSDIDNLWKTKEAELLARSAYEWYENSRKKAFSLCEQAIYSIVFYDLENVDNICVKIEKVISYDIWKMKIIDIMADYPKLDMTLTEWVKQLKVTLRIHLNDAILKPREGKEIDTVVKIKSRDAKNPNFKEKPVKIFFEKRTQEQYTRASVHGVKGETYDAILLHIKSTRGNTLTPSFLNNGSLDTELMRIAYVAMTRPRKLLIVAMPNSKLKGGYSRFPKTNWEYQEL